MLWSRRSRAATSAALLVLLGALGTGLPSHHHDAPAGPQERGARMAAAHHSHATQLVEQADRVPSTGSLLVVAPPVAMEPMAVGETTIEGPPTELPRPRERAPPPSAPRAPPFPVRP